MFERARLSTMGWLTLFPKLHRFSLLLVVASIVCGDFVVDLAFCDIVICAHSSLNLQSTTLRKRELVIVV